MSTNKHALIRYKILDQCFRNPGKKYFIEDLVEACCRSLEELNPDTNGISLRTIRDDIAFMKSAKGWQVELGNHREGKRKYYRYTDPEFSINNMPLNDMEVSQLQSAIQILTGFRGMPQFEWMTELLHKLKLGMADEHSAPIMEFDHNQYLKGLELLGELYNAIYYKKVLEISYQPFESESPQPILFHPYYLKQYNNRWFLFGYNPENGKPDWNLAIDRIVDIKEKKGRYVKNNSIDWTVYFDDIIGVTRPVDGKPQKITLHIYGKTGHYVETKPLHGSQRAKWLDANTLEVRLELIVNYELERLILSYADSVKVLAPKAFLRHIQARTQNSLNLY